MTMTNADWHFHVRHFDSAIEPEKADSPAETDANDAYRRMLADAGFRHSLCLLLAVGPGAQAVQSEVERIYKQETTPPMASFA